MLKEDLCVYLVDGKYGNWSEWTTCTKFCGGGLQRRMRICNNPPPFGTGKNCEGPSFQIQSCSNNFCEGLLKLALCIYIICTYSINILSRYRENECLLTRSRKVAIIKCLVMLLCVLPVNKLLLVFVDVIPSKKYLFF